MTDALDVDKKSLILWAEDKLNRPLEEAERSFLEYILAHSYDYGVFSGKLEVMRSIQSAIYS